MRRHKTHVASSLCRPMAHVFWGRSNIGADWCSDPLFGDNPHAGRLRQLKQVARLPVRMMDNVVDVVRNSPSTNNRARGKASVRIGLV